MSRAVGRSERQNGLCENIEYAKPIFTKESWLQKARTCASAFTDQVSTSGSKPGLVMILAVGGDIVIVRCVVISVLSTTNSAATETVPRSFEPFHCSRSIDGSEPLRLYSSADARASTNSLRAKSYLPEP